MNDASARATWSAGSGQTRASTAATEAWRVSESVCAASVQVTHWPGGLLGVTAATCASGGGIGSFR
ncbi:MAG: hypothetical protein IV100_08040 [Myxococcales bacterium]|nr:hypothetical protein [Myxococcales bacterium]